MSLAYFSVNLILGIFVFFFFHAPVFAVLTITDVSPASINLQSDVISISASASGLQNTTQYLQVGITKEGEASNYFGFTKNQKDEWYKYKTSPTTDDFSSYFYNFTPVNGSWSGQIFAKVDIDDTGFKGQGNYTVKLFKYISSSPSYSDNTYTIAINIAATPTPTPTPSPNPTSTPAPTSTKTPTQSPSPKSPTPTPINSIPTPIKSGPTVAISPTSVLGESTRGGVLENSKLAIEKNPTSSNSSFPVIFIVLGIVFIMACAILAFWQFRKSANLTENE